MLALNTAHHLSGIAHLRHPLGRDKAGRFNVANARIRQPLNQLDFGGGGHQGARLVLQPVAGGHFK